MDSLFPFLQGLAPLQHVGLSRRTADDRQPRNNEVVNTCGDALPKLKLPDRRQSARMGDAHHVRLLIGFLEFLRVAPQAGRTRSKSLLLETTIPIIHGRWAGDFRHD